MMWRRLRRGIVRVTVPSNPTIDDLLLAARQAEIRLLVSAGEPGQAARLEPLPLSRKRQIALWGLYYRARRR